MTNASPTTSPLRDPTDTGGVMLDVVDELNHLANDAAAIAAAVNSLDENLSDRATDGVVSWTLKLSDRIKEVSDTLDAARQHVNATAKQGRQQ